MHQFLQQASPGSVCICLHVQAKAVLNAVNVLPQLEQADKLIARMPPAKWAAEQAIAASESLVICLDKRPAVALHLAELGQDKTPPQLRRPHPRTSQHSPVSMSLRQSFCLHVGSIHLACPSPGSAHLCSSLVVVSHACLCMVAASFDPMISCFVRREPVWFIS